MVSTTPNRRALQREAQTAAIKVVARRLIAEKGVAQLSLREVAREMGLVSSALYRYFATRDELLTALIFDAYNELGAAVERAEARVARADCHLIVLGTHGKTGMDAFWAGSVAHRICGQSRIPLLLIPVGKS